MKLTSLYPQIKTENDIQLKKSSPAVKSEGSLPAAEADRVDLSHGSKEVRKMQEVLQQVPEVRAEKVEALKARIERGEYQVEPREIADRMLASLLSEEVSNI